MVNRVLEQMQESGELSIVRNRHEGYGISAEHYITLQKANKSVKTDMDNFLKLLPAEERNALNVIGSLYNSAIDTGVEAMKLAAQCKRILADLYDKERDITPIEEYMEKIRIEEESFEEIEEDQADVEDTGADAE